MVRQGLAEIFVPIHSKHCTPNVSRPQQYNTFFSAKGVKEENDVKLKKCWVFLIWSEESIPFAK